MKTFIRLGIAASLATLTIADVTFHSPVNDLGMKRDYLTCQETYSGGSITCGNSTSHYCYDPTLNETCCLLDDGYCKQGDFCAPVAGFCCHDGEDPITCATRFSFSLPAPPPSSPSTTFPPSSPSQVPANPTTQAALISTIQIQILAAASTTPLLIASAAPVDGFAAGAVSSGLSPDFTAPVDVSNVGGGAGGNGTGTAASSSTVTGGGSASGSATTVMFTGRAGRRYGLRDGDGTGLIGVVLGVWGIMGVVGLGVF